MRRDLDELLGDLVHAPADHSLAGLAGEVTAGIARERAARHTLHVLAPAQAAAVAVAVAIGLAAGGAAGVDAAKPQQLAMLSTDLAPSNLLVASR